MDFLEDSEFISQLFPFAQRICSFVDHRKENTDQHVESNLSQQLPTDKNTTKFHFSKNELSKLTLITLTDMVGEQQALGFFVILRILALLGERRMRGVVEDHAGNTVLLDCNSCLGRFIFSRGMVLIVKEPFLTMDCRDMYNLVCFSPTDIIIVDKASKHLGLTTGICWTNLPEDCESPSKTALGLKEQGNKNFFQRLYHKALEMYLAALNITSNGEDESLTNSLYLNISATYLELRRFENALDYALKVRNNLKGFYRAGRAYYELREFKDSYGQFKRALKLEPSNTSVSEWLAKCSERLREEKAINELDIQRIRLFSEEHPRTLIDCAEFIGPIRIATARNKSLAVVATKNIPPGTVLVVSKAVATFFGNNIGVNNQYPPGDTNSISFMEFVANVADVLINYPTTFGQKIHDLVKASEKSFPMFCEGKEPVIDVGRFLTYLRKVATRLLWLEGEDNCWGFFVYPSYINKCCVPNAFWRTYNDVMVIQSTTQIRSGEEVLLNEFGCVRVIEREISNCKCVLCSFDRLESAEILQERAKLREKLLKSKGQNALEEIIHEIQETYSNSGRTKFQIDLFGPYLQLSLSYFDSKGFGAALWAADQALAVIGLDRYTLQKCVDDKPTGPVFPDGVLVTSDILQAALIYYKIYSNSNAINKSIWSTCCVTLCRLFFGTDTVDSPRLLYGK